MAIQTRKVSVKEVKKLIRKGYQRWTSDETPETEGYSIQTKFGLNKADCLDLFNTPGIKGLRVGTLSMIEIINDLDEDDIIELDNESEKSVEKVTVPELSETTVETTIESAPNLNALLESAFN